MAGDGGLSTRRRRTRDLLVAALRDGDAVTRTELCRRTGLSASAVSTGVALLAADGLVEVGTDGRARSSARGRRPDLVRLRPRDGRVLGIDFGHKHIGAAVASTSGQVLGEQREDIDVDQDPLHAIEEAVRLARRVLRAAKVSTGALVAIAGGLPRPLDRRTDGRAEVSAWTGIDAGAELSRRLGRSVVLGNDADLGAWGERAYGAARGIDDLVYVKASHGVGAGLVLGGRCYWGASGMAGEIGHTQLAGVSELCRCGSRGCLEAVVSITSVRQQLQHVLNQDPVPPLGELGANKAAARVITDAGRMLGRVLADVVNCLNPAVVILGGELGAAGAPLVAGVRESVDRYSEPAAARAVRVVPSELQLRAELLGAVALAAGSTD